MLELDHVFCLVSDPDDAVRRLEDDGWVLDAGRAHAGQGTRNRRLPWREQYLEVLWVCDEAEASANPLRLDRRAAWRSTGASPVGIALRGMLDPAARAAFRAYDALGPRIWIHRDNEDAPERPLVLVLESDLAAMARRRRRILPAEVAAHRHPGDLREVRIAGLAAPSLPACAGPPITFERGSPLLELVADPAGSPLAVSAGLAIRR